MKKQVMAIIILLALSPYSWAGDKFGALAVDKNNGFYYGWSYDHSTMEQANTRALNECAQRGGNCSVVLELFGADRCGAYRTIDGAVGTAYGWGKGPDQSVADRMANEQCLGRSNGNSCNNHVWACNANVKGADSKSAPADLTAIRNAVVDYYDNNGEWAGKFRMSIEKIRVDGAGSTIKVHVKYIYFPIPGNNSSSGYDQRIFTINVNGNAYTVTHMDEYMSAKF